jgi:hypothetical protein
VDRSGLGDNMQLWGRFIHSGEGAAKNAQHCGLR